MSNLWNILNEDSSTPPSSGSCKSSIKPSCISNHSKTVAQSSKSHSLEKMSLDFVAPGSRSAPITANQRPCRSTGHAYCVDSVDYDRESLRIGGKNIQPQHSVAYASTSTQDSPWTSINSASNYKQTSTTRSTAHPESKSTDASDHGSPPTNHQIFPSGSSRNGYANTRREPRHSYGEEERAFIMVCTILRDMTWKEIEKEFRERFPAGQKRRHQEAGLWPTYPDQERTASGLTCSYYRIREQWGIPKVRGVSDEQKPEVKAIVKKTILSMHDFPDLQNYVQRCP